MNVMNAGLCQNGAVLTGRELEQYSRRKGLCQICAGSETHRRAGKLFKRNQWEPLTVRSSINGSSGKDTNSSDYLVYKGYCLQPTCYTLEQAKELLGEKPISRRRLSSASVLGASERRPSGASANANANITSASSLSKCKTTPPVTWKRASSTGSASNHSNNMSSSSLSVCDYIHSSSHINTPRRGSTHYETAAQRKVNSQRSLTDSTRTITTPSGRRQEYQQQQQKQHRMSSTRSCMSGRFSPTESMMGSPSSSLRTWSRDVPFIALPTLENRDTAAAAAATTTTTAVTKTINDNKSEVGAQDAIFGDITEENASLCSAMDSDANKAKRVYCPVATTQKKLKGRTIKKLMKALTGKKTKDAYEQPKSSSDSVASCSSSSESWIQAILPGSGFVAPATSGEVFRAVHALDLAANDTAQSISFSSNHFGSQDLNALCLQSQRLDNLDIETVLAGDQVDSLHRRWLSEESLLDDYDFDHDSINSKDDMIGNHDFRTHDAHEIFFDLSGTPMVRLSHVCSGDVEELELEANLDDFPYDDFGTNPLGNLEEEKKDDDSDSAPFLVFKTRASLENAISSCEQAVEIAKLSDDPSTIQRGIEARDRLDALSPLRELHMTKYQLKKRIKNITKSLQDLDTNKLVARYEFAMEKDQLTKQLNEEILEENRMQQHVIQSHELEDFRLSGQFAKVHVKPHLLQVRAPDVPRKDIMNSSIDLGSRRSIVSELEDSITDIGIATQAHMTVFQSAPLAYVDPSTGTHHVCPLLDFEYEARALTQSLKDTTGKRVKVNLEFDIATTDRLSAFLANSESRVMHLSCHGHPEYLALENGFGGMQVLSVQDLKRFVGVGAGNLEVVFVSACHSKAAGIAFLDAGIKHVICCRQDDKFRDEGAIEFARSFYRALALNNTLKQAFKIAQEAMRVSPMVRNSKAEYEKFILLPELPDSDPYHDVHIFQHNVDLHQLAPPHGGKLTNHSRILPRVPRFFIGRESDMYTVLEALRSSDLVRIQGGPGVGKSTLVAATARYIEQRQKSFLFDDILWLAAHHESVDSKDTLSLSFSRLLKVISRARNTPPQEELAYGEYWGLLLRQIQGKRTLIVIDGKDFTTIAALEGLDVFLSDLLKISNAKVVTVGLPWTEQESVESTTITIDALDFDSSVLLFSRVANSPSISAKQIISGLTASNTRSYKSSSKETLMLWRRRKIYGCIGKGIPSDIRRSAQNMSDADLAELLKESKRPLAEINSRSELIAKIKELEESEALQQKNKHFLLAKDTNKMIKELHCLSRQFPSLEELDETEKDLQHSLQIAIASKQYENADQLQRCLANVHKQISTEIKHNIKDEGTCTSAS